MAQPSSSFSESTDAMIATTASSGEPSVNQATPEFHPVHEGQRPLVEQEILNSIVQEYKNFIYRGNLYVLNPGYLTGTDIQEGAKLIMTNLELDLLSINELQQFKQDILLNPKQLTTFFQSDFQQKALGVRFPWE